MYIIGHHMHTKLEICFTLKYTTSKLLPCYSENLSVRDDHLLYNQSNRRQVRCITDATLNGIKNVYPRKLLNIYDSEK
jgi:hypothetical protein